MAFSRVATPVAVTAANIVGPSTVTLKVGAGILHHIVVNAAGTTATIYDNSTATPPKLGTLNLGANFPVSVQYDAPFLTGLTIVTTGAAVDLTVVFE